jgi:3-methyladenine DNA glycosylase AlkD
MVTIIEDLREELRKNADDKIRKSSEGFFKEGVKIYGLRNGAVHTMSREFFKKLPDRTKRTVFGLCEDLWKSGYIEESFVACNWSYAVRKQFEEEDIKVFEQWIDKYVTNWASCDTFCNHTVGEPIMKFTSWIINLKEWAKSQNRWVKRGAAVSLIIPARKGLFLPDIFTIAETILTDGDDMVQKGYGWMLKEASKTHQGDVYDFVIKHKSIMPRTALRYAIEKMPPEMKTEAMKK